MKNILAVDTATKKLAISLLSDSNYYGKTIDEGFTHSEKLLPSIEKLLKEANIKISDIDLLVCTRGPGSFTGLRIGMSTLKGISTALDIPLISVPTLDVYAYGRDKFNGLVLPIIDARKKSFYTAIYKKGIKNSEDLDLNPNKILEIVQNEQKILLTGIDAKLLFEKIEEDSRFSLDEEITNNYAKSLISLGINNYKKEGPDHKDQGPLYIRKSEAEILLDSRKIK